MSTYMHMPINIPYYYSEKFSPGKIFSSVVLGDKFTGFVFVHANRSRQAVLRIDML